MNRLWRQTSPSTSDLQSPFLDRRPPALPRMEIATTKDLALHVRTIVHPDHRFQIPDTHRRTIVLRYGMALYNWRTTKITRLQPSDISRGNTIRNSRSSFCSAYFRSLSDSRIQNGSRRRSRMATIVTQSPSTA